ncbi:MAG: hypothetical protein IJY42_03460 [Clostridia bacterium]|nr:hypothetical protein [Clostridia bacterium]
MNCRHETRKARPAKRAFTKIVALHYCKLVIRSLIFLSALGLFIYHRVQKSDSYFGPIGSHPVVLGVIWCMFAFEMVMRFFPSPIETMGCQKQLAQNYKPRTEEPVCRSALGLQSAKATFWAAAAWIMPNAVMVLLYLLGIFNDGIMVLITLAYSVCDIICILFFCPFQTWIMKNQCCVTCRIYNWDYAMMFTPFLMLPHPYTWSLLGMALVLLLVWEIQFRRHPERFSIRSNASLSCATCKEKLCHHKGQLRRYLKNSKFSLKGNALFRSRKGK